MKALTVVGIILILIPLIWCAFYMVLNIVVHDIFRGPEITFFQSVAALFLLGFIGSAFRSSGGSK